LAPTRSPSACGRLWRAAQWSDAFGEHLTKAADELSEKFKKEKVVRSVTNVITERWRELHHMKKEATPTFEPITRELRVPVSITELLFEPSPTVRTRPAAELSHEPR
jgi:putative ATP-dependent endonuclease of OLD family